MAHVRLTDVSKAFGDTTVIPNVNLDINDKEFIVLVGPSGCGKTTTLRMIAGLEDVSSGTITIADRDVTRLRPGLRNCAMVFQNYALYPHKTVRENIIYGLKVRKTPPDKVERLLNDAVRILELEPYLQRRPKHLSGGQRQRVAIGRAIVRNPDVFLFDEPLSNLDAKLRIDMRAEIKELHRRLSNTMIYVTHDQVEAMTLADRIVVMHQGNVEQVAGPLELYEHPANTFVAGFIGAPSMNFLPATVVTKGSGLALRLNDGCELPIPAIREQRYRSLLDQAVTFGIRPEHMDAGEQGAAVISVRPQVIEPLGAHTLLIGATAGHKITPQIDAHYPVHIDQPCPISIHMEQMHIFDVNTGQAY